MPTEIVPRGDLFELTAGTLVPALVLDDLELLFEAVSDEIAIDEVTDELTDAAMIEILILKNHLTSIKNVFTALQSFLDGRGEE